MQMNQTNQIAHVDVQLKPTCARSEEEISKLMRDFFSESQYLLERGDCEVPRADLDESVDELVDRVFVHAPERIPGASDAFASPPLRRSRRSSIRPIIHVYHLNDAEPFDEMTEDGETEVSAFTQWSLPCVEFQGLWPSLVYDVGLKQKLLNYVSTTLLFSESNIDPTIIACNRIILLHGPPGTGKTSLCKGLAQLLSIRLHSKFNFSVMIEINAHSLFSKWFSESGKLVMKLFQKIHDVASDEQTLVFVLVDEVESLAAARSAAMNGTEPSDAIRVVNALLTQLDKLKRLRNVLVFCTSNITGAIDVAFIDRADVKLYVGLPSPPARYVILRSCLNELVRAGLVASPSHVLLNSYEVVQSIVNGHTQEPLVMSSVRLAEVCDAAANLSGRALRKLPFLAFAHAQSGAYGAAVPFDDFLNAMLAVANTMHDELADIGQQ